MSRVNGKAPSRRVREQTMCMALLAAMLCPFGWGYLPVGSYRAAGRQVTNASPAIFQPTGSHPVFERSAVVREYPHGCVCGRRFKTERGLNQHVRSCCEAHNTETGDPRP